MSENLFNDLIPKKLFIQVKPGGTPDLVTAIDSVLNAGWWRDHEAEIKNAPILRERTTCYRCDAREDIPAAGFTLYLWDDDIVQGASVDITRESWTSGSEKPEELTTAQRDRVLQDFHDNVLCKLPAGACVGFGIKVPTGKV